MTKVYSYFNRPPRGGLSSWDDKARQEFAAECDIQRIISRAKMGVPPKVVPTFYGDFSDVGDYQSCIDRLQRAQAEFDSLPSAVRDRFGNNPARLLAFVMDANNREEAIKLGLIAKPHDPIVPRGTTEPQNQPPPVAG